MSDLDALVATVLDRPGDETPRLVLADWYDEFAADRAFVLRLPGWWAIVPAVVARGLYRHPTAPRARYLVWRLDAVRRQELLPAAHDPACVIALVDPTVACRAGAVCHCGAASGLLESTGRRSTAPGGARRAEREAAHWEYLAAAADRQYAPSSWGRWPA